MGSIPTYSRHARRRESSRRRFSRFRRLRAPTRGGSHGYRHQGAGGLRLRGGEGQLFPGRRGAVPDPAHHQRPRGLPGAKAGDQAAGADHQGDLSLRRRESALRVRQGDPPPADQRRPGHQGLLQGDARGHPRGRLHHSRPVLPAQDDPELPGRVSGHLLQPPAAGQHRGGRADRRAKASPAPSSTCPSASTSPWRRTGWSSLPPTRPSTSPISPPAFPSGRSPRRPSSAGSGAPAPGWRPRPSWRRWG